ncbi:hypothetical protein ACWD25_02290 [Streptomyces sp. NPDC002920]
MTVDRPAMRIDYHGHIVENDWLTKTTRQQLHDLAERFPPGTRVVHACGRKGTVALDQPAHVPGVFSGHPTSVCLTRRRLEPMVFATWDNEYDFIWRVWVPVAQIRTGRTPAVNRPGNKARIGGRR